MANLQLMGEVDDRDDKISRLEFDNEQLHDEIESLKLELVQTKRENQRAIGNLRRQLSPLFGALKQVFGEMDAIGGSEPVPSETTTTVPPRAAAVWQSWKSRLGEGPGKIIDALLLHRQMNTQQLSIATGYHRTSIPAMIFKLNKAGLINKSGGVFSLKEL